jgi:hypothetical protein
MTTCIYCGHRAGFFSKYHNECFETSRDLGSKAAKALVEAAVNERQPSSEIKSKLSDIVSQYKVASELIGQAFLSKVDELANREPLEPAAAQYLLLLCELTVVEGESVSLTRPYDLTIHNLALSRNLWLIMHGQRVQFLNPCDVVLQGGDSRLAEFGTVIYRKSEMVSSHTGGYNGVSVRVASGLYYRFGDYAGHTVSSPALYTDVGFWVLSNKAMYFCGELTSFQIPYHSILRFKPYPDGLGFFRNTGTGREETFTVLNPALSKARHQAVPLNVGWFLYNLVMFLVNSRQLA